MLGGLGEQIWTEVLQRCRWLGAEMGSKMGLWRKSFGG